MVRKIYTRLALSGGETKGISQIGALQLFWERGQITHESITHYAGASIGSVIALLLVCGYSPYDIWNVSSSMDTLSKTAARQIPFQEGLGLMSISGVAALEQTSKMVVAKFGKIPTLAELHKLTRKILVISVVNMSRRSVEYCSYRLTPDLPCVDAVKESCNIPGLFQKIQRDGSVYVDGALLDNFPIAAIDDGKSAVLGITTSGAEIIEDISIFKYMLSVVSVPIAASTARAVQAASAACDIFELSINSIAPLEFMLNREKRRNLFVDGYRVVKDAHDAQFIRVSGVTVPLDHHSYKEIGPIPAAVSPRAEPPTVQEAVALLSGTVVSLGGRIAELERAMATSCFTPQAWTTTSWSKQKSSPTEDADKTEASPETAAFEKS